VRLVPDQRDHGFWRRAALPLAVGLAIAVGIYLAVARDLFVSPACDGPEVTSAVQEIFKGNTDEKVTVGEIATLAGDGIERCAAHVVSADEDARVVYSVAWRWWSPVVKLETVAPLTGPRAEGADQPGVVP
jgi:hypothetical protein